DLTNGYALVVEFDDVAAGGPAWYEVLLHGIQQTTLETGLVASYSFSGNARDESGNGNDGVVHGATLTTDRFGNSNSAYTFNGSSSYIEMTGPLLDANSMSC